MINKMQKTVLSVAVGSVLGFGSNTVLAAESADAGTLGEIVITAQKRSENLQEVPLAVSAIGAGDLQAAAVTQFQDLSNIAPSLTIRPAEHPVNANVSIRGVGTYAFGIGVESSVAVLVDGVPMPFQGQSFMAMPNADHVEVLRGPQSTLYGKSASAGLVNIITKNPTKTEQGEASATATNDDEHIASLLLSGPMSENTQYLASINYDEWAGNVENLYMHKKVGGRDNLDARLKFGWQPNESSDITLSLFYDDGGTEVGRPFIAMTPGAKLRGLSGLTMDVVMPGVNIGPENQDVSTNYDPHTRYAGGGGYLKGEFNVGENKLVSLTSFDHFHLDDYLDQDETSYNGTVGTVQPGNNIQVGEFQAKMFTQELRLMSPDNQPLRWTTGLYYSPVEFTRPFYRGPYASQANWLANSKSTSSAAFGQIDWKFDPSDVLTLGARYQKEDVSYNFLDIQNGNAYFSGSSTDSAPTWRASIRHDFTPDMNIFYTHATGHKGQTYDLTTGFNANRAAAGPIKPEKSVDDELGIRSQFFNRMLTLNATIFHTTYNDLQSQTIQTLPDGTQNFRLTNVGQETTKGVELDAAFRPNDLYHIDGSATFLNATYTDYPIAQCYSLQTAATGCIPKTATVPAYQVLTGQTAVQSPKVKYSLIGEYTPEVFDNIRGVIGLDMHYQSGVYFVAEDPQTYQPSYAIANLSVGLKEAAGRWQVTAFLDNVANKKYYASLVNASGTFGGVIATQVILPRDFDRYGGVRVTVKF